MTQRFIYIKWLIDEQLYQILLQYNGWTVTHPTYNCHIIKDKQNKVSKMNDVKHDNQSLKVSYCKIIVISMVIGS